MCRRFESCWARQEFPGARPHGLALLPFLILFNVLSAGGETPPLRGRFGLQGDAWKKPLLLSPDQEKEQEYDACDHHHSQGRVTLGIIEYVLDFPVKVKHESPPSLS